MIAETTTGAGRFRWSRLRSNPACNMTTGLEALLQRLQGESPGQVELMAVPRSSRGRGQPSACGCRTTARGLTATSPPGQRNPDSWPIPDSRRAHGLENARRFLREHHRGVLATRREGGAIQQSPVLVNVTARAAPSSRAARPRSRPATCATTPWAGVCVFTDRFFGRWIFAEGRAEALLLPEAMDPLIDY